jgi:DNA-binding MarR family transcriptional regulator
MELKAERRPAWAAVAVVDGKIRMRKKTQSAVETESGKCIVDHVANAADYAGLNVFRETICCAVKQSGRDLTLRQIAVLLVCKSSLMPKTVRGLARHLQISKPAVTRAVDRLEGEGLLSRLQEVGDRRSIVLLVTERGSAYCSWFTNGAADLNELPSERGQDWLVKT